MVVDVLVLVLVLVLVDVEVDVDVVLVLVDVVLVLVEVVVVKFAWYHWFVSYTHMALLRLSQKKSPVFGSDGKVLLPSPNSMTRRFLRNS